MAFPGTHAPTPAEITLKSVPALLPFCYDETEQVVVSTTAQSDKSEGTQLSEEEKRRLLEEVDRQQQEFGVQ